MKWVTTWWSVSVLVLCLCHPASSSSVVSLPQTDFVVYEGDQFIVPVHSVGVAKDTVNVVVEVLDHYVHGGQDFVGTSQAAILPPGTDEVTVNLVFTTEDDDLWEADESFTMHLMVTVGDAVVVTPYNATVTIVANDGAFGVIGFTYAVPVYVEEMSSPLEVDLVVQRSRGNFDSVTVSFEVDAVGVQQDIFPVTGSVIFDDGDSEQFLTLTVLPDTVPENDEIFLIRLTGVTGGSTVRPDTNRPQLNETTSELQLVVRENDAPIRFSQSVYKVDEGQFDTILWLTIYRGLALDGTTSLGPINQPATVSYYFLSGSAQSGLDFKAENGSLDFTAGGTEGSISVEILSDSDPEELEQFTVVLANPLGEVEFADPHQCIVTISANDDHNGVLSLQSLHGAPFPIVQVNEDSITTVPSFTVVRSGGTFGTVSIRWRLTRNATGARSPINADVDPVEGTVTFMQGDREKRIILTVIQDSMPEWAERYILQLLPETVQGGARAEGILEGELIVEDSDEAHGVIQFTNDDAQSLAINTSPRRLLLSVSRTGGTLAAIRVLYQVAYIHEETSRTDIVSGQMPAVVIFPEDKSGLTFDVPVRDEAFLQVDAYFEVTLLDVSLAVDTGVGPFNTPRLGAKTQTQIVVLPEAANGEVGFATPEVKVGVVEPDGAATTRQYLVPVTRRGTNGGATVYWSLTPTGVAADHVTLADIAPWEGSLDMASGQSRANILLEILADDLPETDEEMTLVLTRVEPIETQRLRPGAILKLLIIAENDNAGGIFEFAPSVQPSYLMEEEGAAIELPVVRTGGALVTRCVQHSIAPNGEAEFYGATNVLKFLPGEIEKYITIQARGDGVPELGERFQLRLRGWDETDCSPGDIGEKEAVNITVPENENPYGVMVFEPELTVYVEEGVLDASNIALIPITRAYGTYGTITVDWRLVEPSAAEDLAPIGGTVVFHPGMESSDIVLTVLPDGLPEEDEYYTLLLGNTTNGALLGDNLTATVVIIKNDDAIFFKEPSVQRVAEGDSITFTIKRNGSAQYVATVKYRTEDDVAAAMFDDYEPTGEQLVVFEVGETEKNITVYVLEDVIPEPDEPFFIQLYGATGDAAVFGTPRATVIIEASDGANGIFSFYNPSHYIVEEGVTAEFPVQRLGGIYYKVQVHWEILDNTTLLVLPDGQDFVTSTGNVTFLDRQETASIEITPLADSVPEFPEMFVLRLYDVTGGGPGNQRPELAAHDLQVTFEVTLNDDPYGLFAFPAESREVSVAEDYLPGAEETTRVALTVDRRQGAFTTVQVAWEIFSYQIAGAGNLPPITDLLFLGTAPVNVTEVPDKRRPRTGTHVLQFDGCPECHVTVAAAYQPSRPDIEGGFSLSAWVQTTDDLDGYIIAKTTADGTEHWYSLKVTTVGRGTFSIATMEFRYRLATSQPTRSVSHSTSVNLLDGRWHFLVLTIDSGHVSYYVDNRPIAGTRPLGADNIVDGEGVLWVGAKPPGEEFFTGLLQDVRIFSRRLDSGEIRELYETPSIKDVRPISGYLTLAEGVSMATIEVQSVPDNEEEASDVFAVKLISATGGASVSDGDNTAILTVLKSDNANGEFGFSGPCVPNTAQTEDVTFICPLQRQRGDTDSVAITWKVFQYTDLGLLGAELDFLNSSGELVFAAGQRNQSLEFQVRDDVLPELEEYFSVRLIAALPSDGEAGSTPVSGASLIPQHSSRNISVALNDHPYGLLQFDTDSVEPPWPWLPLIAPATQQPRVSVTEEVGIVSLLVVRAGGLLGAITAEFRTVGDTARSSGKTPPDFEGRVGTLQLDPLERYTYINITILDNFFPEGEKHFEVELLNPGGGADIGVGSRVTVSIQHSDQAYGVFQFADDSLEVSTEERMDEVTELWVKVVREGGSISDVTVRWKVVADPGNDLLKDAGEVVFLDGQTEGWLLLQVTDDTTPELDETLQIQLVNVTQGTLGDLTKLRSTVRIEANDDPYGVFVISQASRPVTILEVDTNLTISVERKAGSGSHGTVRVGYTTLAPQESYPFLPAGTPRASRLDYEETMGTVVLTPGERSTTFAVEILQDEEPEMDETFFVTLVSVELTQGEQNRPVLGSPRLGQVTETYGQVIIQQNDIPNGQLQLSVAMINVPEDFTGTLAKVVRGAGAFGTVTVKFEVIPGTATYGRDYTVTSTEVILGSGEREKRVPVDIINDGLAEVEETFTIRLINQITGGATLGVVTETLVTIEASDDPNGAFGFEMRSMSTNEPSDEDRTDMVKIPVVRTGGTIDIVTVTWQAQLAGGSPASDISAVEGSVSFLSNQARALIRISILADTLPEGAEEIEFRLTGVNNGGRIDNERNSFTLTILPNDNPHGTVQFETESFTVHELPDSGTQFITVSRVGGSYGQLQVYYVTEQLDLLTEATADGSTVYDYYQGPRHGKALPLVGSGWDVTGQLDPLQACATFCLVSEACMSFDYNSERVDCNWFSTVDYEYLDNRTGYVFYEKDAKKTGVLYSRLAKAGLDYEEVQVSSIVLTDGATEGNFPVTILGDDLPELPEVFRIKITAVELIGGPPLNPSNLPQVGNHRVAMVTIAANDDANGMFRLYSKDPRAEEGGQLLLVEERDQFSVEVVVERQGGTIGTVSVTWVVSTSRTTAQHNADYVADGATLTFNPGETTKAFTIGIEDDGLPENDETVVLELRDPLGGAELGTGSRLTIVIMANDYVAGLLGFTQTSHLVSEGDVVVLTVSRSSPALGRVSLDWQIVAVDSQPPDVRFRTYTGSLFFDQGEQQKQITLTVLVDNQPKVNQEYRVELINIVTEGIRETGVAAPDPQSSVAVITIEGGNDPHGVFSFAPSSQELRVQEGDSTVDLVVERKFGAIGVVRVYYSIKPGSLPGSTSELASAGPDFLSLASAYITMYDGESSGTVSVALVEDDIPEVDEVFLVELLKLELISPADSTFQPSLGSSGTVVEVVITANDGTQGEVIFPPQSAFVTIDETATQIVLVVERTRGTYGAVSVFCFAQSLRDGAVNNEDFSFQPTDIHFGPGVSEQFITVTILQDTVPEPDEKFEILLASPKNGLTVGTPGKAVITILANDQASGVVNYESPDNVTLNEPTSVTGGTTSSTARIQLVRAPGIFGVVNVPFSVLDSQRREGVVDLQPTQGVVTFLDKEATAILEVSVIADDEPEEVELFYLILDTPDGGATLGPVNEKMIIVERNDAPYGLLEIFPAGTRDGSITVEEADTAIYLDIVRSLGSMDEISVELVTQPGTAMSLSGGNMYLAPVQQIVANAATHWHSFEAYGTTYAVLLSSARASRLTTALGSSGQVDEAEQLDAEFCSRLYRWQGTWMEVQTVETDGATRATSFSIGGEWYLFVANQGSEGRRGVRSRVYRLDQDGTLSVLQDLTTTGATDATFFSSGASYYLFVSNYEDNGGSTAVNSNLYVWDNDQAKFSSVPVQYVDTKGARAVTTVSIGDTVYVVVANHYDTVSRSYELQSVIYKLDSTQHLSIHQQLPTEGAVDVASFTQDSSTYLVIAQNRDDVEPSTEQSVTMYVWNSVTRLFVRVQEIPTSDVRSVQSFDRPDNDHTYLAIASGSYPSVIYEWDATTGLFNNTVSVTRSAGLYPTMVPQTMGPLYMLTSVPVAGLASGVEVEEQVTVYDVALIGSGSDYIHRSVSLTMLSGQTELTAAVYLLDDPSPEDTEGFSVALVNPRQGAEIGQNNQVLINIPSNDDGHGVVEFAQDSLDLRVDEVSGEERMVQLNVVRGRGTNGRVVVRWRATGEHSGTNDINPVEGQVEFASGQSAATISIMVRDDEVAEIDETSLITLVEVVDTGTSVPGRGAKIGEKHVASLTVLANDSPHGVVSWEKASVLTTEPTDTDSTVMLYIVRQQGLLGHIQVTFMTKRAEDVPLSEQAISGRDYASEQRSVDMFDKVNKVPVEIVIKPDNDPEVAEVFLVELTDVQLVGTPPSEGAAPSVRRPGHQVSITISENDNARGVVEFDVVRNFENRYDTYEGVGVVQLPVRRTVGYFGSLEVAWQASPREADSSDFTPGASFVSFLDGQVEAFVELEIVDDDSPENLQTFDVQLIRVTAGGATLGQDVSVRVGIIKNDSPNGVFSFVPVEKTVRESTSADDPAGVVNFDIQRIGTDGEVNVHWRLTSDAAEDFDAPLSGMVTFTAGQSRKTISMRTKQDGTLEGQELYTVALVSADNNADISPTEGEATIIILADPGATGVVGVKAASTEVLIGEPSGDYDGTAQIVLTRGVGVFGEVAVSWQISPRTTGAFVSTQDKVVFEDGQLETVVVIQALDDSTPEEREVYILELISATGDATVDPSADTASVTMAASDYPHGLFEFTQPAEVVVLEDDPQVSLTVVRNFGQSGQVRVAYVTSPHVAEENSDYLPSSGWLTFSNNQRQQTLSVQIVNDAVAEPPETFYVNLTDIQLEFPVDNNYTVVNGLQLDMAPDLGPLAAKAVIIEKNDNSEGFIQFTAEAVQFVVTETEGVAQIPIQRGPGTYGLVGVRYQVQSVSATPSVDYMVTDDVVSVDSGESQATLDITIVDDTLREFDEQFTVTLFEAIGGAALGQRTTAMVTIAKSDYPNGKFGFVGPTEISIANPETDRSLVFTVGRTEGLIGRQTLYWRVMGPNNPNRLLEETNDLIHYNILGEGVTSGSLTWPPDEGGEKTIAMTVKPYVDWEIAKVFVVTIYDIQGFPANEGSGEPSPTAAELILTVEKHGDPNGIVRFTGVAQVERTFEEPNSGSITVEFPIHRKEGTIGDIQVHWRVDGPAGSESDLDSITGVTTILADRTEATVTMEIVADDDPELDETFTVVLTKIEGGAEIDTAFNTSSFIIRYNDHPHGLFSLDSEYQTVVVAPGSFKRQLRLNVTRTGGTVGRVRITFGMSYDQAEGGISYVPSSGSVTFEDAQLDAVMHVDVESAVFLAVGSTFTVSLMSTTYIGVGMTMPPELVSGGSVAKVTVPAEAANSQVGFKYSFLTVQEEGNLLEVFVERQGTYGVVQVDWQNGYSGLDQPQGYVRGSISPGAGTLGMEHAVDTTSFTVQLSPQRENPELFALHLPRSPSTTVGGGARLWAGHTLCRVEPHGVVQFAEGSREVEVTEREGATTEVVLNVQRKYGSQDNIQVRYRTYSATAVGGVDFGHIESGAITMDAQQIDSTVFLQILPDTDAETDEHFFVNFTSVTRLPTDTEQDMSPRLSSLYSTATITIRRNSDPYGVLSVRVVSEEGDGKVTEPGSVTLVVTRTGGLFGEVSVLVRTVGGREPWDQFVGSTPGGGSETIGQALGARDLSRQAFAGEDYERLDAVLDFEEDQYEKSVTLYTMEDSMPEDDEEIFVYISPLTEGIRVARPSTDDGKQGYAMVTVRRNDYWGGWVGFYAVNSSSVTSDEDREVPATLTIERKNSSYGDLSVYWQARVNRQVDELKSEDIDLSLELDTTGGKVECLKDERFCMFDVLQIQDQIPENETSYIIELTRVGAGGDLDPSRRFSNVTMLKSDYPNGLIGFSLTSRYMYVNFNSRGVELRVERQGYQGKTVTVRYSTRQLDSPGTVAGVTVYHALEARDYQAEIGQLTFLPGVRSQTIPLTFEPSKSSQMPYPKMFHVVLSDVTNLAQLGSPLSVVTFVNPGDKVVWDVWPLSQQEPLDNSTIDNLMSEFGRVVTVRLDDDLLSVVKDILDRVLTVAERNLLQPGPQTSIMSVFCQLLDPGRGDDATRGHWQLSKYLERFAFTYLLPYPCDTCCTQKHNLIYGPSCTFAQFAVAKWYPEYINGYTFPARESDRFEVPETLLDAERYGERSVSRKCFPLAFVDYSSEQWFTSDKEDTLLNSRVISASIEDQPGQYLSSGSSEFRIHTDSKDHPAKRADCVYFDEKQQQWTTGQDVCDVENNLALALYDYVDCSCKHMSLFAVKSDVKHPDYIGYPIWFHISCFVCMAGLAAVIICHHVCSLYSMFSANLHMHMCFAMLATEMCYVIDAYLSPGHLLDIPVDGSNYRCIVMSLFLHYFFLAQFTWMMTQAINYWKILVLNDEHTERKYMLYFMVGWAFPALLVVVFYVMAYVIYRFGTDLHEDRIYGDVTNNEDICFVTNAYAGLAGVIAPTLVCLMVVGVVFIQAFQLTPQWQAYDDIYRGRYNISEIRILLMFWACITLTWLWGGLHMVYSQVWMLAFFCIFNVITGVYAFIAYGALRNPCLPCLRPQKALYGANNTASDIAEVHFPPQPSASGSVKGSRASLVHDTWERDSTVRASTLHVKRTTTVPTASNLYIPPPVGYEGKAPSLRSDGHDSQDFDDLIYALKTGVYSASESSHPLDREITIVDSNRGSRGGQYERKRINIADTHV